MQKETIDYIIGHENNNWRSLYNNAYEVRDLFSDRFGDNPDIRETIGDLNRIRLGAKLATQQQERGNFTTPENVVSRIEEAEKAGGLVELFIAAAHQLVQIQKTSPEKDTPVTSGKKKKKATKTARVEDSAFISVGTKMLADSHKIMERIKGNPIKLNADAIAEIVRTEIERDREEPGSVSDAIQEMIRVCVRSFTPI